VGAVWSGEVVKPLPFISKFRPEIDVAFVAESRIEFLLVGSLRALYLSNQLRRTRLDRRATHSLLVLSPRDPDKFAASRDEERARGVVRGRHLRGQRPFLGWAKYKVYTRHREALFAGDA
jgi:hypothetical protein